MKMTKRLISAVLALTLLLSVLLTGCSAPKLVLGGTPGKAGTVADTPLSTGEYLTYLYSVFYDLYYQQGYYQYAQYGYDVWGQELTYGEGDDAQQLAFGEYIKQIAADRIVRQEALRQMLAEEGIEWDKERLEEFEKTYKEMEKDAMLPLGISDEHYISVNKQLQLNEASLLYGRYDKDGTEEIAEKDLRAYFDKNYLSYKMISIALTDSEGKEQDEKEQKKVTDQLDGYLTKYNKNKNFEAIVDEYNKSTAGKDEKVEESTDESNRVNADATQMSDEELVKAIRGVKVGEAKVVTYKADGSNLTAALILRLDINSPKDLFTDETENIIYGMKYEAFDEEIEKRAEKITLNLKKSVVKSCDPANFVSDLQG